MSVQKPTRWLLKSQLYNQTIPKDKLHWLLDEKSLTKRIKKNCVTQFRVKVIKQRWVLPDQSERLLLKLPIRQKVLLRQVVLFCGTSPVVFAHSLIPLATLRGEHRRLACLQTKPLGQYLFSKHYLKRSQFECAKLSVAMPFYHFLQKHYAINQTVWGRRSLFLLKNKQLLVSEYFLPQIRDLKHV